MGSGSSFMRRDHDDDDLDYNMDSDGHGVIQRIPNEARVEYYSTNFFFFYHFVCC